MFERRPVTVCLIVPSFVDGHELVGQFGYVVHHTFVNCSAPGVVDQPRGTTY